MRITSAVTSVGFVNDRMSCIVLRSHWVNISVLNVHAPTEDKSDNSKDSSNEELQQVFNKFF
jgi:hypothetical protein